MIFINVFPRWLNNLKPTNRRVVVKKEKPVAVQLDDEETL